MNTALSFITNNFPSFQTTNSPHQSKNHPILESIKERVHFFVEFIKNPFENGSIVPSCRQLTNKMVQFIPQKPDSCSQGRKYCEIGPGTGSITEEIVKRLGDAQLDLIELNPSYCAALKEKYAHYKNVHIHSLSITDWHPDYQYDAVISGLPLNGFTPELVQKCVDVFKKITKKGGTVSYFDYPIFPKIFSKLYWGEKKKQYEKLLAIKNQFFQTYGFHSELVKENFPTANVQHFRID